MSVLVDTNVIADVIFRDPVWAAWATTQITRFAGETFVNPFVYAELCYHADSVSEVDLLITQFGFQFEELPREALFLAAKAYGSYRQRGGTKSAPLPDFFIGAHAQAVGHAVLTRDRSRYETYFPSVTLISP